MLENIKGVLYLLHMEVFDLIGWGLNNLLNGFIKIWCIDLLTLFFIKIESYIKKVFLKKITDLRIFFLNLIEALAGIVGFEKLVFVFFKLDIKDLTSNNGLLRLLFFLINHRR
jgi:hypothetical protein